jgi:hypothetical protein
MAPALRILLWILVVIAPGGVLLLPFLAADELRRRKAAAIGFAERISMIPSARSNSLRLTS